MSERVLVSTVHLRPFPEEALQRTDGKKKRTLVFLINYMGQKVYLAQRYKVNCIREGCLEFGLSVWFEFSLFFFFFCKAPPDGGEAVSSLFGLFHKWLPQKYNIRWARKKNRILLFKKEMKETGNVHGNTPASLYCPLASFMFLLGPFYLLDA